MTSQHSTPHAADLLLLEQAAKEVFKHRNTFWRHQKKKIVPPPICTEPNCRWSRQQLRQFRQGLIRRNSYGIWFEKDHESGEWVRLGNQYIDDLPQDAE